VKWQDRMNLRFDPDQARAAIHDFAREFGYSGEQLGQLDELAKSDATAQRIAVNRALVEQQIHTVKIPTILFGGRRYDRALPADRLK